MKALRQGFLLTRGGGSSLILRDRPWRSGLKVPRSKFRVRSRPIVSENSESGTRNFFLFPSDF